MNHTLQMMLATAQTKQKMHPVSIISIDNIELEPDESISNNLRVLNKSLPDAAIRLIGGFQDHYNTYKQHRDSISISAEAILQLYHKLVSNDVALISIVRIPGNQLNKNQRIIIEFNDPKE